MITNCGNNYGKWQHFEKLIPKTIVSGLLGLKIPIYGDGNNIRDWIFVDDHVDALIAIMERGKIGENYCIGANNQISNKDLVMMICSILDKKFPKLNSSNELIEFVEDRKGHDFRYSLNTFKINDQLKWEAKSDFKITLEETINWYSEKINFFKEIFIRSKSNL